MSMLGAACKGRGICPSCMGRRMCQTAANLVEHVLPHRQRCADDHTGASVERHLNWPPAELRPGGSEACDGGGRQLCEGRVALRELVRNRQHLGSLRPRKWWQLD